ncbi:MAG: SDR family oxidoreductase [Oscillospiraceae bacterium]|nr:SDR family oxidoreductase [Candidatus Ruminococcus equi]
MKALITGASSGIGRDMARYLASLNYDLIIVARREDRLNELKNELKNVNVKCISADLSNEDEVKNLYEITKDENIDMLINNAGFGLAGEFVKTDLDMEMKMVDTNVKALHILTKLFLKDFVERDSGIILNVASSASFMSGPLLSTYYATKNYVLRLSEAIYEELRQKKSKVSISVLCPGPVNTEFNDVANVKFALDGLPSEYVAKLGVDKALKGKLIIIPGAIIKLGIFFRRFVSEKFLLKISYRIQKKKN